MSGPRAYGSRTGSSSPRLRLGILFPSVRARHYIRVIIHRSPRTDKAAILRDATLDYWRNWTANEGGQATAKNPLVPWRASIPGCTRNFLSHVWWCDRANAEYVRRFLALCSGTTDSGLWRSPPLTPVVQNERRPHGLRRETHTVRAHDAVAVSNVTIIDGRCSPSMTIPSSSDPDPPRPRGGMHAECRHCRHHGRDQRTMACEECAG